MASVNKVILVGNLGRNPQTRYTPEGRCLCQLALATTVRRGARQGSAGLEARVATQWHRVVLLDALGEEAELRLKKGDQVWIEGHLRTRKWTDRQAVQHSVTEVIAEQMLLLGQPWNALQPPSVEPDAPPDSD